MTKLALIALFASFNAFAELPLGKVTDPEQIIDVLSKDQSALADRKCLRDAFSGSASFNATVAVRGKVQFLEVNAVPSAMGALVCVRVAFEDGGHTGNCACRLK